MARPISACPENFAVPRLMRRVPRGEPPVHPRTKISGTELPNAHFCQILHSFFSRGHQYRRVATVRRSYSRRPAWEGFLDRMRPQHAPERVDERTSGDGWFSPVPPLPMMPLAEHAVLRPGNTPGVAGRQGARGGGPVPAHLQQSARGGSGGTEIARDHALARQRANPRRLRSDHTPGRTPGCSSRLICWWSTPTCRPPPQQGKPGNDEGDDVATLFRKKARFLGRSRAGRHELVRSVAQERRDVWNRPVRTLDDGEFLSSSAPRPLRRRYPA